MWDDVVQALTYALGLISASVQQFSREDATALLVGFGVTAFAIVIIDVVPRLVGWSRAKAVGAVRKYIDDLYKGYVYRFRVRGFTVPTCKYSLWLAFILWLSAFLVLSWSPSWTMLGIIVLSALAVVLTLSVLGYKTRGPRGDIWRFGIFYEPSFALVSTFLVGKLPDLASRALSKLATMVVSLIA